MKAVKKLTAVLLCAVLVALGFSGCSSAGEAETITDETMLIAYTEEKAPFIYTDENGELTGFDVEVMKAIFDDVKNDYKDYQFVQVDADYRLGEDAACIDSEGNTYIAYIMIGGVERDTGSFNKEHTFTENIIDNRIITVTPTGSDIADYGDLAGKKVGYVSAYAATALAANATIQDACASVTEYTDVQAALADLDGAKLDALVIDEFDFNTLENASAYTVLPGELDTVSYVYAFEKYDWYVDSINEAIAELKDPDYNDADEFTPLVEKYFGYNASNFTYTAVEQ